MARYWENAQYNITKLITILVWLLDMFLKLELRPLCEHMYCLSNLNLQQSVVRLRSMERTGSIFYSRFFFVIFGLKKHNFKENHWIKILNWNGWLKVDWSTNEPLAFRRPIILWVKSYWSKNSAFTDGEVWWRNVRGCLWL